MDNNNEIEEKNSTQADVESTSLSEKKNGDSITKNKIFKPYKVKDIVFASRISRHVDNMLRYAIYSIYSCFWNRNDWNCIPSFILPSCYTR